MSEPIGIDDVRWHEHEFIQPSYPGATSVAYETLLIRGRRGYVFWKPTGYWWSYFGELEGEECISTKPFSTPDEAKENFVEFYGEYRQKTPEQIMNEIEQSYLEFERRHATPDATSGSDTP